MIELDSKVYSEYRQPMDRNGMPIVMTIEDIFYKKARCTWVDPSGIRIYHWFRLEYLFLAEDS